MSKQKVKSVESEEPDVLDFEGTELFEPPADPTPSPDEVKDETPAAPETPMPEPFEVGIYILHYQDSDMTHRCVAAFQANAVPGQHIVVIDNGSDIPFIEESVIVHRLEENTKVVDAWNSGMQAYPAVYYFLANNDAFPTPDCLIKLIFALDDPSIGIVAPGTSDLTVGAMFVAGPNADAASIDLPDVDGHLWGWKHALIERIGYPDCEGHTHVMCWGSNRDFCRRTRNAGLRVVCVRSAYVHHEHEITYDRAEADTAGQAWLLKKWNGAL